MYICASLNLELFADIERVDSGAGPKNKMGGRKVPR